MVMGNNKKKSGGVDNKLMKGICHALSNQKTAFFYPRRLRSSVARKKLETAQHLEPVGVSTSIYPAGELNDGVVQRGEDVTLSNIELAGKANADAKKANPPVDRSVLRSLFIDLFGDDEDDDEENLQQNSARTLSPRFDPSSTSRDSLSQLANSCGGVGSPLAADDNLNNNVADLKKPRNNWEHESASAYTITRASLKRNYDGCRSNLKKLESLAYCANVLVTNGDKGWREFGHVVLENAAHNEWKLAVKLSGVTKYSYKVKHMLERNRYSRTMQWKGGKDWALEFPDRSQWNLFKELHEECYNRNVRAASVKTISIPGVRLIEEIDDDETELFVRSSTMYVRHAQTDVEMAMDPSRVLYDMDSDDELWLKENECAEISAEFLEKTIDMFEKFSYMKRRANFTDAEIEELVIGIESVETAKVIYEHWRQKRERKGMPLIRHLQPPLWQRYQQQLKEWEQTVGKSHTIPEKPPMFAFCLKPADLDVPSRGSKRQSHRRHAVPVHNPPLSSGNRRRVQKRKRSLAELRDHRKNNLEGPHEQGAVEQLDVSDILEFQLRNSAAAAKHSLHIAKLKREKARRLHEKLELAIHKAVEAMITAEAVAAAHDKSNGGDRARQC